MNVKPGDLFVKNDNVVSVFMVDKVLDLPSFPVHVRLVEQGGNNRTVTVALSVLNDEKFWKPQSPAK